MMVWISSMNRMAPCDACANSFSSALKRFSKSPRYLVPASKCTKIQRVHHALGQQPPAPGRRRCNHASPSAMAVLPTPGSPTSSGLFLRRRTQDLRNGPLDLMLRAPPTGQCLPLASQLVEVAGIGIQRTARKPRPHPWTLRPVAISCSLFAGCIAVVMHLGDAVRDVVHHVDTGNRTAASAE
jgi:hypothetical protein